MSKFKIGDIVQVITQPSIYTWWAGEVIQVESEYVRVKFRTENTSLWFIDDEVTLLVEAATNEINKPLTIHYNTSQYKAAVWHVYKKNFTEQGGAVFANYLEAQERLDKLIVDATKSGMISSAGFLVTADKAGENEYYVDVYVQPCFGEYHSSTTLEINQ
mgnify:FL=1